MAKLADLKSLLDQSLRRRALAPSVTTPVVAPVVTPVVAAPLPRRAIAAGKHADADIDLARAFADVQRMPPSNKANGTKARPAPVARQRIADERDALAMSKYGSEPAPQTWDIGQEIEGEQTFLRRGLGTDVLTGLRRGRWVVQSDIDLHGLTAVEAHDALADFLLEARARGLRCVRVIHGKGLTSPNREPVLKGKVRRWLAQWDDVLAYCEASRHAGGGGAVVVLLQAKPRA
jgi:DNA-nicking Smr family endonuclease